jgi:hypothetical protein
LAETPTLTLNSRERNDVQPGDCSLMTSILQHNGRQDKLTTASGNIFGALAEGLLLKLERSSHEATRVTRVASANTQCEQ